MHNATHSLHLTEGKERQSHAWLDAAEQSAEQETAAVVPGENQLSQEVTFHSIASAHFEFFSSTRGGLFKSTQQT